METPDLFAPHTGVEVLGPQSRVLRGFALPFADELLREIAFVESMAPFRHMVTPGGFTMSVALTNCGALGWTTDRTGYAYTAMDPETGAAWPPMPEVLVRLASAASQEAGLGEFVPDACLINRYEAGSRLSLHQDRNERDLRAPIVSVSLGMPAVFLFGGLRRTDPVQKVRLQHADVVCWGGADRLRYHGVMPVKDDPHPLLGHRRINLTLRKAG